MNLYHVANQLN